MPVWMCRCPMFLRIVFPVEDWPGWLHSTLYFAPAGASTSHHDTLMTLHVEPITRSDYLADCAVVRASTSSSSSTPNWASQVALKLALADGAQTSLQREAGVYASQLAPLQGHTVPNCYGLYRCIPASELPLRILEHENMKGIKGDTEIPNITLLAMEWWGECVDRPFVELPLTKRFIILAHLHAIHKRGLIHGDFAERNVLISSNEVRIIDFDLVEPHECLCSIDFAALAKGASATGQVQCEQLWECCVGMAITDK